MRQATRRKPKREPSCVIVCNLDVRGRSMPSVIPAWRKMTGRCGVWDRSQCSEEAGAAPGLAARGLPAHYCGRRPRRDCRGSGGAALMPRHVAPVQQGQCGSGGGFPPSVLQGRISISMITFMSVCVNLE